MRELKATVTIKTTHPDRPVITIPVTGPVRGDLLVSPASAFFGVVKTGAEATQTVTLTSRTSTPFHLLKAECSDPHLSFGKPVSRQDGGQVIALTLDTKVTAFIDTTLNIQTDVPDEETLTVPVTALVE